jgi:hypothetical protein
VDAEILSKIEEAIRNGDIGPDIFREVEHSVATILNLELIPKYNNDKDRRLSTFLMHRLLRYAHNKRFPARTGIFTAFCPPTPLTRFIFAIHCLEETEVQLGHALEENPKPSLPASPQKPTSNSPTAAHHHGDDSPIADEETDEVLYLTPDNIYHEAIKLGRYMTPFLFRSGRGFVFLTPWNLHTV